MPESISSSSCPPPNQSTVNVLSSMPPASEKPIQSAASNPHALVDPKSNHSELAPEQPRTVRQAAAKDAAAATASRAGTILSNIEAIIESVIDGMLHRQPGLAIPIRVKKKPRPHSSGGIGCSSSFSISATAPPAAPAPAAWTRVLVRFPGRDDRESWRFS